MLSDFDVTHIHDIMAGHGDWASAKLLRLMNEITGGEPGRRLREAFPAHGELVDWWWNHPADDTAPLQLVGSY